jgi:uncharacterized protein
MATRVGSFCTAVLRTADAPRALAFYTALLGWTARPASPDHQFFQIDGQTVASVHAHTGGADRWVPHVSVTDIDAMAASAIALRATVVDQTDVAGVARLATVHDPEGAAFGLWQAASHEGAELVDRVGAIWWIELLSRDVAAARRFYGSLFGWGARETSFEPFDVYTVFTRGDQQEGGVLLIDPEWNVAPHWNAIVAVDDCDATLAAACELGGSAGFVHTVPEHGRIGGLYDARGAGLIVRGPIPAAAAPA